MAAKSFPILFIAAGGVSEAVLSSGLLKKLHDVFGPALYSPCFELFVQFLLMLFAFH